MQHIQELVRSAIGYDAARGDQVSVINVRFDNAIADDVAASSGSRLFDFDKNDLMRGAELLVLAVVSGMIIFFVVRPLLATAGGGGPMSFAGLRALTVAPDGGDGGVAQIGQDPQPARSLALPGPQPAEIEQRIDMAKIEGQVKMSSVKSVAEFVQKHPEESVSILRGWLHEA
jgi:flagellar M-ring protein FliF